MRWLYMQTATKTATTLLPFECKQTGSSERKSAEILSGCFDGCSLPTFVHFAAMDCKDGLCGNPFIAN
jgi:hypothetical protein